MITSIFSLLGAFIILAYIYFDTYTVFFEFTLKFNHGYTKKGADASVDYILMAILILVLQSYVFSINLQRANLRDSNLHTVCDLVRKKENGKLCWEIV